MKCIWPRRKFCVGDQTQPILHRLALGFCVGGNVNFMFCVGVNAKIGVTPKANPQCKQVKYR